MDTMLTGHQDIDHGRWARIDRPKGLRGADGYGFFDVAPAAHENDVEEQPGVLFVDESLRSQHGSMLERPPGVIGLHAT